MAARISSSVRRSATVRSSTGPASAAKVECSLLKVSAISGPPRDSDFTLILRYAGDTRYCRGIIREHGPALSDDRESLPLPSSAFVALGEGAYAASGLTRGPWHPDHQHAGPPIALVAGAIERVAAAL